MPDTTRVLKITGDAFKSSRGTRKQKGGYDDVPGTPLSTTRISTMPPIMKGGFSPSSVASPSSSVASPPTPSQTTSSQPLPSASSVASPSQTPPVPLILTGGTRKALHLVPKKEVLNLVKGSKSVPHKDKDRRNKTRKVIRIQMGNMRKSLHRAKEIVESSKDKPIAEILEILLKAEIIKKKQTETPMSDMKEKLIRGIYRDYLQLRYNAL